MQCMHVWCLFVMCLQLEMCSAVVMGDAVQGGRRQDLKTQVLPDKPASDI